MKTILFFGDSITQQASDAVGFITMIKSMAANENKPHLQFKNAGVGGNKITDLQRRLENDVLQKSPDIVVIQIGVNDVWHKATTGEGTEIHSFKKTYADIIESLLAENIKIILATPTTISELPSTESHSNAELDEYADVVRHLAQQYNTALCDLRRVFINHQSNLAETQHYKGYLTTDGVHLNETGNRYVAQHLWDAIKKLL